jgi:hypothetical protein
MKIFKFSTLVPLAIAIAAALVTQPMRAVPVDTLVITENNSTASGLTAMLTVNGTTTSLPVTFIFTDQWTIALTGVSGPIPSPGGIQQEGFQAWTEPGGAVGFDNTVSTQSVLNRLSVLSDFDLAFPAIANGTTDTRDFSLNGVELDVTFNDNGDVATTPDTGSTLGLLSLSVVALLGATRLRFLQLAA